MSGIEAILRQYLPAEEGYQKTVLEAMNYSVPCRRKASAPHADAGSLPVVLAEKAARWSLLWLQIEMIHTLFLWCMTIRPAWIMMNTGEAGRPPMRFMGKAY